MRERLLDSVARIAFVLFALAAHSLAATTAHWTVVNQPVRLVNGTPVLFRVTPPMPVRTLSGQWLGHDIAFSFDAGHKPGSFSPELVRKPKREPIPLSFAPRLPPGKRVQKPSHSKK